MYSGRNTNQQEYDNIFAWISGDQEDVTHRWKQVGLISGKGIEIFQPGSLVI